ncbi:MAG: response regulator, partial [Candidatus Promineifilaceae bacterium]
SGVEQTAETHTYPLSFPFPFFNQSWDEVSVRDTGILIWDDWLANAYHYNLSPAATVLRFGSQKDSQLSISSGEDRFVATWEIGPEDKSAVQIVLYPDGAIDMNYDRIDGNLARRIGIQSGSGGSAFTPFEFDRAYDQTAVMADGLMTDFGILRQQFLHQNLRPLVYIELFAALFLIVVFPYFFHIVLVKPLNRLVAGVRAVNDGDLQTQVPVQSQDEIGLITESFNRMVASVYATDQHLESQVRTRTAQLTASEARYRKLFETITSGVMVFSVDENGRFFLRDFNQAGERFGAANLKSAIGSPLEGFLPDLEARKLIELLDQVYQSEPLKQFPSLLLNQKGNLWQEVTAYRLLPDEIVVVFDDVTDRLANEARQQRLAVLEERERIGRELHDDLGQVLGFVNVQSHATLTLLDEGNDEQARTVLRQLADVTQDAHDDVREYILGIRHEDIRGRGSFFDILARYLDLLDSRYGLEVHLSIPSDWRGDADYQPRVFAPEVETQLLRIIQEALTNARKYASVKEADLFFTQHGDNVQILISDKGQGFDPGYVLTAAEGHFGLDIMRERAEKVGGQLEVRSQPGSGVQIIVQLPLVTPQKGYNLVGVRTLLVDDHQLYLEGLRNLLTAKGMIVVGTAVNGLEAQEAARQLRPDLILMDVEMPERNGLDATRIIKAEQPDIRIVMLTIATDSETLFQAIKYGASGYLLKSLQGDTFFQLLAEALAGETVLSPSLAAYILNDVVRGKSPDSAEPQSAPILTTRQLEVLNLIVQDKTNQEIGEVLHISENTVKYHVRQILSQLHLRSRYELAVYAEEEGLLD